MDTFSIWISLICGAIGLIIFAKPAMKLIRETIESISKRSRQDTRYKQTALWKEIVKVIGNRDIDLNSNFEAIGDHFDNYEDITKAIKNAGLEDCNLIIGIDFTASNEWQGRKTFDHRSLHYVGKNNKRTNPYQKVIGAIAETLSSFDSDNLIPVFGFGDKATKDTSVFPFYENGMPCAGFDDVLRRYNDVVQTVDLSGPTSFAPIIRKAIEIAKSKGSYHILLIIADGQVTEEQEASTRDAIVEASLYPLSIILVGVGDGPWDMMSEYDEKLPTRKFDNFQFVDYHKVTKRTKNPGAAFALHALMEIPDQYQLIKSAGLLSSHSSGNN